MRPAADSGSATPRAIAALEEALRQRPTLPNSARRTRKGFFARANEDGEIDSAREEMRGSGGSERGESEERARSMLPDARDAWATLRDCTLAAGMHPDSATESIVDFALALGKPFAVVPCCVCSVDFPARAAMSYDAFVAYLVAKAPTRIRVATLGFEGRNLCVYALPDDAERASPAGVAAAFDEGACAPCAEPEQ